MNVSAVEPAAGRVADGKLISSLAEERSPANGPAFWIQRLEWLAALLVTVFAVAIHLRFVTNVGGLWRDETNSVNLATLSSLGEMWRSLEYDSFPILYFFVLRAWTGIFGAGNDAALRALGLIIGLGVLGVLWANARAFGARLPVLSFALLGLNPMFIRYGDSNRAYGLGIVLLLLTLRSFWRLVEEPAAPTAKRVISASLCALLSVHCLYYNAVLLVAIAAGALAVAVRARAWRTAGIILGIGAFAAVTLLPYAPMMIRMREWTFLVSYPCDFPWLWSRATDVMGSPIPEGVWLWTGLFFGGLLFVAGYALWSFVSRHRRVVPARLPAPVLFAAITLGVGVAGYAGFLRLLNYYTQPWYYITAAAFAACTLDIVFGAWPAAKNPRISIVLRCLRPVVALALLSLAAQQAWKEMPIRHTNMDLVAARLQSLATKEDLILIAHWEKAIPFSRYYHGAAEVVTLPPIEDHRFHRYDLMLAQMKTKDAHQPVLARMEQVLRSGHRVFFAGEMSFPEPEEQLPVLPVAFRDDEGVWHGSRLNLLWHLHTGQFMRAHSTGVGRISVPVPNGGEVQHFEKVEVGVMEGWR